jgi:adenylate kinase
MVSNPQAAINVKRHKCMQLGTMAQVTALTGTPGTGKSTVAEAMVDRGWRSVELNELAHASGAVTGRDDERSTDEVDVDLLRDAVVSQLTGEPEDARLLLVSHMAHLMPCDAIVVLRCSPRVLGARLEGRGWHEAKVRENVEAEAVGVVLVEAMEVDPRVPVYELDTTHDDAKTTVLAIEDALAGDTSGMEAGWVDWSEEVMGWF